MRFVCSIVLDCFQVSLSLIVNEYFRLRRRSYIYIILCFCMDHFLFTLIFCFWTIRWHFLYHKGFTIFCMVAFMTCIYLFTIGVKMDLKWIHFAFTCMWALTNVCEKLCLLPAATKLWPRLCFYTCVWFCSRGGLRAGRPPRAGRTPPWQGETPRQGTPPPPGWENPPEQTPPGTRPPREADSSIRSTSGRYASYWNAFLFIMNFKMIHLHWPRHTSKLYLNDVKGSWNPI